MYFWIVFPSGLKSASKTLFQTLSVHDPNVENDALVRVDGRSDTFFDGMFSE